MTLKQFCSQPMIQVVMKPEILIMILILIWSQPIVPDHDQRYGLDKIHNPQLR